jgi:predicted component of type VI protein secretion system
MPRLVLTKDGQAIDEYIIGGENTVIGRSPDCDFAIDDESISRRHLHIICILNDCFLEDLNSANGTLVNSKLTRKCPLADGDTIAIGHHRIKYDATRYDTTPDQEYDRTRIQLIKQLGEPEGDNAETPQAVEKEPEPAVTMQPDSAEPTGSRDQAPVTEPAETAIAIDKPDLDHTRQLDADLVTTSRTKAENPKERTGNLIIVSGRREGQNMPLNNSVTGIDKGGQRVAAITRRPDGYFLVPLADDNHNDVSITVNGRVITRKIYPLWSNDVIGLGGTEMEFLLDN